MKDHLIFDTTDAQSILDTDSVGAFVRSANGDLITDHLIAEQTNAFLIAQGLLLTSKLPGAIGNGYSFTVVDTGGSGPISFTEVGGAVIVDLKGLTPTNAQVATLLATSAYIKALAISPNGNVIVASIQSLAGGADESLHKHLDVYSAMADGFGNPISSTNGALDVNITSPVVVNTDINGIYDVGTNPNPSNVGLIGSSRAAAALANQTIQFTGAAPSADGVLANIEAQDVNSFGMLWNGTSWDRAPGSAANGATVNVSNASIAVTQSTSPWVVSGTITADQGGAWTVAATQSGTWTVGLSEDHSYGVVGANTLRTAAQIGNATGAADFGAGITSAQTLRVVLASDDVINVSNSDAALADVAVVSTALTAGVSAVAAVAAPLAARKYLWLYNNSNKAIFIGGATVTTANGFPISPGSYMEMRAGAASPVNVIGSAAGLNVRTLEVS